MTTHDKELLTQSLKDEAQILADEICQKINAVGDKADYNDMKYPRQDLLENVVRILQEKV